MSQSTSEDLLTHAELKDYRGVMGDLTKILRGRAAAAMNLADAMSALQVLNRQHEEAYARQTKVCTAIAKKRGKTLQDIADIDVERSAIVWKTE